MYLYQCTFPELLDSKVAVTDIQGHLWAGPDRQGINAPNKHDLFINWQREVQAVAMGKYQHVGHTTAPQAVVDYFQATKGLSKAPEGLVEVKAVTPLKHLHDFPQMATQMKKKLLANPPRFATSYSGMKDFLNCPCKWGASKYFKTLPYIETEENKWGNRVHLAFENVINGKLIPEDIEIIKSNGWAKYLQAILQAKKAGALVLAEKEICCTKDLLLCGWKDWNTVWFRNKSDVLVKNSNKITYIDWKTGKRFSKRGDDQADTFQIEVTFALVSLEYPEIEEFNGKLIYLKETDLSKAIVSLALTKADLPRIWEKIFSITRRMEEAWENESFRMQTSGLCKAHCGHTGCPHCGKK